MAENKVLTGYGDKDGNWRNDPNFLIVLALANYNAGKENFVPCWKKNKGKDLGGEKDSDKKDKQEKAGSKGTR